MTKKEIVEALGIDKKTFIKDLIIAILVIVLIFSVLFVIKHIMDRYLHIEEPIFLETKVVAYIENDTAYIPLTFLDNLENSRYAKEIKIVIDGKEYFGEYDDSSYDITSVPRNYAGSRRFYKNELYQKPYAIRKQTILVNGLDLDMKADTISIHFSTVDEKEYPLQLSFTDSLDKREIVISEEFITIAEPLEGVQILMTYPEWKKSDAGEYKLNKKGISNYLEYLYN